MNAYAFTFGTDHDEAHRAVVPNGTLSSGYVVIEAPHGGIARNIMVAIFGERWAFFYKLDDFLSNAKRKEWYPDGPLLRIAWLDQDILHEAAWISEESERIAEDEDASTDDLLELRYSAVEKLEQITGVNR